MHEVENSQTRKKIQGENGVEVDEVERGLHRHCDEDEDGNDEIDDSIPRRARKIVEIRRLEVENQRHKKMRPSELNNNGEQEQRYEINEIGN